MNYSIQFNSEVFVIVICLESGKMRRKLMKLWNNYCYFFSSLPFFYRLSLHICKRIKKHTFSFHLGSIEHVVFQVGKNCFIIPFRETIWKDKEDLGSVNIITVSLCFVSGWRWTTCHLSLILQPKPIQWNFHFYGALCTVFQLKSSRSVFVIIIYGLLICLIIFNANALMMFN